MNITEILGPERLAKGLFWSRAWSLASGCTPVSPGCAHCWLRDMAHRFPRNYPEGIVTPEGRWTGKVVTHPERLALPLRTQKPQVWAIWSDLGHEAVPPEFIGKSFQVMRGCEQHIFLLITKRPQRFIEPETAKMIDHYLYHEGWPPNLWLLTTAENQEQADIRLPQALQIPAAKRLVLYEPALGPLDLTRIKWAKIPINPADYKRYGVLVPDEIWSTNNVLLSRLAEEWNKTKVAFDGVICGGETGARARPSHPDWFRKTRDDCQAAGVPFFFKSWGEWYPYPADYPGIVYVDKGTGETKGVWVKGGGKFIKNIQWSENGDVLFVRVGKKAAGRLLDGQTWNQVPLIP
ncbi:MAG: DUF5131 family protein [Candidatus Cryosericum sp.]